MVPEYLTPLNGGLLSPGQMAAVMQTLCARLASERRGPRWSWRAGAGGLSAGGGR